MVWRTLPRLRLRHTFRAWLYRVASNVAISQLRRDRCQPTGLPEELADSGDTLDAHVERAERRTWLADALVTLPEAQRLVLMLRFQAGLSYEEIAALTRRPLGTVKSTLARACERLRQMLLTGLPAPHGPEPRAEARSSSGHQGESAYA